MRTYIEEELAKGFIVPFKSPASAGFFFVKKREGTLRPCIDYRGLNDITVKFQYPLPLVPPALEQRFKNDKMSAFKNWSTTVKTTVFPCEGGRPETKSS